MCVTRAISHRDGRSDVVASGELSTTLVATARMPLAGGIGDRGAEKSVRRVVARVDNVLTSEAAGYGHGLPVPPSATVRLRDCARAVRGACTIIDPESGVTL